MDELGYIPRDHELVDGELVGTFVNDVIELDVDEYTNLPLTGAISLSQVGDQLNVSPFPMGCD